MTVNPQVSLLDLTLEAGIPGDVMWSLTDRKHFVCLCRIMMDCLWIRLMMAWMRRFMVNGAPTLGAGGVDTIFTGFARLL